MAKIVMTGALFLALAMVAMASVHTTITTSTVVEEESRWGRPGGQEKCQSQIQQQQQLPDCQAYLHQDQHKESLRMVVPRTAQQQKQCCQQFENIDEECRCEAIRHLVRTEQQQLEEAGGRQLEQLEKIQQVVGKAMDLPRQCKVELRQCEIRISWP